ncbi:MAG TPA: WYL domain-containing protein [Actinopolymorphaceae bacterium]
MAASRKSERLMNLVICLLVSRGFVPKARLRQLVEDYRDQSPEAFEKMFERDKEELRDLGIPIEVGQTAGPLDPEVGYRIRRSEFELPPLTFTAQEVAVLGLAARVWQHASMAEATSRAVVKLGAEGVDTDTSSLAALEPRLPASEPAFEPLWQAVQRRRVVSFDHRRPGTAGPQRRTVEPWGILNWRGRWYVVGHDRDRGATRMFRLSRIAGEVRYVTGPGAYEVPEGVDIRAEASRMSPGERRSTAHLRVRAGAGHGLRRRASEVTADGPGWDRIEVSYADPVMLAEEIATYGADVVALDPPDLRDIVIRHLKSLLTSAEVSA